MNQDELIQAQDKLLKASNALHAITISYSDLSKEIANLISKHGIDNPQALQQAIDDSRKKDRLMSIGIVGRVKAGKSSLLNALFFEGENVLPSAATPMTAALTTLTYGDIFSAEVDFYNTQDIQNIEERSQQYERRLKQEIQQITEKRKATNPQAESEPDFKEKIIKSAERTLKQDEVLTAAYDQFQRMQQSGLLNTPFEQDSIVKAANTIELAQALLNFVGAEGKYMPFTKSVNITLPLDSLRDIRVIDTPGFNDPVQSREARTCELLKSCDAIFIVSPAGQFLSAQDLEMMGRITQKEGVQELVVVASQVDTQLFGSEKRDTLQLTLSTITTNLCGHMVATLERFKKDNPEVGTTFDKLIEQSQKRILFSSGISHALSNKFNAVDGWTEGEKTVWANLQRFHPDYFTQSDVSLSKTSLDLLSNVDTLKEVIADVRSQKDHIMQNHLDQLISTKYRVLSLYRTDLLTASEGKIEEINNADIKKIEAQIQYIQTVKMNVELAVKDSYKGIKILMEKSISEDMLKVIDKSYQKARDGISNHTLEDQEVKKTEREGVFSWLARKGWGGGYDKETVKVKSVITFQIENGLTDFLDSIRDDLGIAAKESALKFEKILYTQLFKSYREAVGNDEMVNDIVAQSSIHSVINALPALEFLSCSQVPNHLKGRGTLKGIPANAFLDQVDEFINKKKNDFKSEVRHYRDDLLHKLPANIAPEFTKEYEEQMNTLKEQVSRRKMTLDSIFRFQADLKKVAV